MKRINSYLYITGSEVEKRYNVTHIATRNVEKDIPCVAWGGMEQMKLIL